MNSSLLHQEIHGYFVDRVEKQDDSGTTYYGFGTDDSYPVAIKVIDYISEKHLRDLEKLVELEHNNLVNTHIVEQREDKVLIVRDWVESSSLYSALQNKKYSIVDIVSILKNNLLGLSYLHKQNYYHGALTLKNVFEWEQNSVLITDFVIRCREEYSFCDDAKFIAKLFYFLVTREYDAVEIDRANFVEKISLYVPDDKGDISKGILEYYDKFCEEGFQNMREALIDLQPIIGSVYDLQEGHAQKNNTGRLRRTRMLKKVDESTNKKRREYGLRREKAENPKQQKPPGDEFPELRLSTEVKTPNEIEEFAKSLTSDEDIQRSKLANNIETTRVAMADIHGNIDNYNAEEDFSEFRLSTETKSAEEVQNLLDSVQPEVSPEEQSSTKDVVFNTPQNLNFQHINLPNHNVLGKEEEPKKVLQNYRSVPDAVNKRKNAEEKTTSKP